MNIKVVLFDADGVMINGEMFSEHLERDFGVSKDIIAPFFKGPFRDCIIGNADLKEIILPYLKEWNWEGTVDEFLTYWFKSEHNIDMNLVKYISKLRDKGIKCYLVTNQEKYRVEYMLKEMDFQNVFDKIYASAHLGHRKPAQEFYEKMYADLGNVQKDEILFWDDNEENIEQARIFGINAELYKNFEKFEGKMNEYITE